MKKSYQGILKFKIFITIFFYMFTGCSNNEKIEVKNSEKQEYSLLRGINYSQKGMFLEAEKELSKILKDNGDNTVLLEELAFIKIKLDQESDALDLYKDILIKDSKNINVLKNLAYLYLEKADYKKSLEYLDRIPSIFKDEEVENLYQEVFYRDGNWEKIETLLEKKVISEKKYIENLDVPYAKSLLRQNKKDKLYFYLAEKYRNNFSEENFIIFKAKILEKYYQEYEKSERIIKRYISEYDYSDEILFSLGENYLIQKKYIEIEKLLKLVSSASTYKESFIKLQEAVENY